jgi:hypothetical protein
MRKLIFTALICLGAAACQTPQQSAGTATGVVGVPSVRSWAALPAPQLLLLAGRLAQACATSRTAEGNSSMTVPAVRSSGDALRALAQAKG